MNLQEYARFDGLGLAELVRSKQVRPRELCDLALAAVEQVNPQLNAVIETFADRPETEAASDPAAGTVSWRAHAGEGFSVRGRHSRGDGVPVG